MRHSAFFVSLAALVLAAGPALATDSKAPQPRPAEIPFANHGGIWSWQTGDDDRTVYFQDMHRQWFKATLFAPAFDLPYVENLRVDSGPTGTLDKWGAIFIGRQRYTFSAFEKLDGPPPHAKKAKKDATKGAGGA